MLRKGSTPWLIRWLSAAPSRWLGRSSAVQQYITGGTHGLSYLRHLVRGNRVSRKTAFEAVPEGNRPVLVIHGFMGTRGSMYPLERRLAQDGFCVFSFNLGPINTRDIRRSAFLIHRKIERILAQTAWKEIDIVAHSMGGLIGLYYIKKLGGHARVRRMITLGTPFRGTWLALAGIATMGLVSASSWQLLPGSDFLGDLHREPIPANVEVHSIAAQRDWLCPPEATRMPGVKSITVPFGHGSLVVSADVYKCVKDILGPGNARNQGARFAPDLSDLADFADHSDLSDHANPSALSDPSDLSDNDPGPFIDEGWDGDAASTHAETAQTRAETAQTRAETAQTRAETARARAETARANRAGGANPGDGTLARQAAGRVTSAALSSRRGKGNG